MALLLQCIIVKYCRKHLILLNITVRMRILKLYAYAINFFQFFDRRRYGILFMSINLPAAWLTNYTDVLTSEQSLLAAEFSDISDNCNYYKR